MASTTSSIRIGIVGYGNLGRGVEAAIARNPDMALTGIYTISEGEILVDGVATRFSGLCKP